MGRWIRLDVAFDETWLFSLSAPAQLAWVKLLCTVKRDGIKGRVKALSPLVASRKWGVGEEDVVKMLKAAQDDGAITLDDGYWTIVNWQKFQEDDPTNRERQQRFRAKKRIEDQPTVDTTEPLKNEPETVTPVTEHNALHPLRNGSHCRVTETGTKTGETHPPISPPLSHPETTGSPPRVWFAEPEPGDHAAVLARDLSWTPVFAAELKGGDFETGFRTAIDQAKAWGADDEALAYEIETMVQHASALRPTGKPRNPVAFVRDWLGKRREQFRREARSRPKEQPTPNRTSSKLVTAWDTRSGQWVSARPEQIDGVILLLERPEVAS